MTPGIFRFAEISDGGGVERQISGAIYCMLHRFVIVGRNFLSFERCNSVACLVAPDIRASLMLRVTTEIQDSVRSAAKRRIVALLLFIYFS